MELKPGTRLRSQVSDVTVVVIACTAPVSIECGGSPMVVHDRAAPSPPSTSAGDVAGTTLLGKRYVGGDGVVEVLCTTGGQGMMVCDGVAMTVKDSASLPSSD